MRNIYLCAALIGGLAIVAFSERPTSPAVASTTPAYVTAADFQAALASLESKLTSLASVQQPATSLPGDHAPAVRDDTAAGASYVKQADKDRSELDELRERLRRNNQQQQRTNQSNTNFGKVGTSLGYVEPPAGLIVPVKPQPVSFTLPGRCGPNGCGVSSQPAIVARGVPVVRQVRQWRPLRRFR